MSTETNYRWTIDPAHSEIQFKVKHLMITTVTGSFKKFEGVVQAVKDTFENAQIAFTAEVASIDTGVEKRNAHLRSNDFFNAEQYPQLKFTSTSFTKMKDNHYLLKGNITIRETTQPIELTVVYGGRATDSNGNEIAGFEIAGQLSRKEFGLNWNGVTEVGGVVVADEVKLEMNVELHLSK